MSESAEALAANIKSRRNITIELTNLTSNFYLADPKVYLDSGSVHSPPEPTVRSMRKELCNFTKTSTSTSGAVGVLTYDLLRYREDNAIERIAIMFSVPYDYNLYENWLALGIFNPDKECNEGLYKEMYYNKEQTGFVREKPNGSSLTYEGRNVDIKATMSPLGRAIMKVEVWDKLFSPHGQHL
ncbi:DELTA-stichotoxin-Hcr4a-like [Plectropomus leopardus]|uniref:DELTA-stichotoxin-Hcr4a-like n=1 Tax=Plectropomus leopardus TaxID=160734 RepID=UPI001C4D6FA5|nr:DELTA-stichotoxin-Hcr4a-like [Plectropomus leopardus]